MVKVVKTGKIKKVVYKGTCHHCNSVLEAEESEVIDKTYDQRDGGSFGNVICQVCKTSTFVYD